MGLNLIRASGVKNKNKGKRSGQYSKYRQIGTGTQRADEVVYTSAFRTRQKFGAASPVRHIPVQRLGMQLGDLPKSKTSTRHEKLLRCECGHEVSERDFISSLPLPKPVSSLADFHQISDKLRCDVCKQRGKAKIVTKMSY